MRILGHFVPKQQSEVCDDESRGGDARMGGSLTVAACSCFPIGHRGTCSIRSIYEEGGFLMKQKTTAFCVDGYEISATFADNRNPDISRHLRHILLTSYAADTPQKRSGDILEVPAAQRYNDSGEGHHVP